MKIFFLRKWALALILCLALAGGLVSVFWEPAAVDVFASDRPLPIYCVEQKEKRCAISFDAAWGNE